MRLLAFAGGLFLLFNFFVGAGSQAEGVVGGYGYRISDLFALGCVLLLIFTANSPAKFASVLWYGLACACVVLPLLVTRDRQTATLALHFSLYSLAGLFMAMMFSRGYATAFAWGMLAGLAATVATFALLHAGIPLATLASLGLAAGYAGDFGGYVREMPRYSGLWGHPNEASHVAALASAAAAYLLLVDKSKLAAFIATAGLLAVFYYTLSRGGLMIGGAIVALAFFLKGGMGPKFQLAVLSVVACLSVAALFPELTARFSDMAGAEANFTERLDSVLTTVQIISAHPFGQSITDFENELGRKTLTVTSPHNGFFFTAAVLGVPALLILLLVMGSNLLAYRQSPFLALLCLQVAGSFLFEQMSGNRSYVFAIGIIIGGAYLRSRLGTPLLHGTLFRNPGSLAAN